MEENKFARLKAALQQAKEACEISPEDKEFQQEYELAKEALKQAQKEVHEGKTLYLFVISLYTLPSCSSNGARGTNTQQRKLNNTCQASMNSCSKHRDCKMRLLQ